MVPPASAQELNSIPLDLFSNSDYLVNLLRNHNTKTGQTPKSKMPCQLLPVSKGRFKSKFIDLALGFERTYQALRCLRLSLRHNVRQNATGRRTRWT